MKKLKKILIIIGIVLGVILLLFILNFIRLDVSYNLNKDDYKETIKVQGNLNNYVPQSITYSDKYDIVIQTSYSVDKEASKIYITKLSTGDFFKELSLLEVDGSKNTKHVGGITTDNEYLWITNDYEVNKYSLEEILDTEDSEIKALENNKISIRGDFCTYNNGLLWIGDFYLKPFYNVPNDNPLLMAFEANEKIDYENPLYIISVPKMVQGLVILNDNEFVFTESFTYLIKSNLSRYKIDLSSVKEHYNYNGKDIPYYKCNKDNLINNTKLPPMAEGLFYKDGDFYILFESSATHYSLATPKINNILKIKDK